MLTALETWCPLPRVDSIMSSASLLSKRTDWPSSSKYGFTSFKHYLRYKFGFPKILVMLLINCSVTIKQIRDTTQEPCGRLSFTKEARTYRSLTHNAICNLNITLPAYSKVGMNSSPFDSVSQSIILVK